LDRGLAVLNAFEDGQERLTQAQLARKLDLPRATVRRALLTLAHLGYLVADDRAFRLAPKVLTLASAYLTTNPVSSVLQPECDRLAETFQTSCTAAVLDGASAVMIARALPRQALPIGQGIGFQVPATRSALGLVLLAGLDEARRGAYDVEPARVAEVVERGYAYVANDVEAGFHSVAVALRRWDGTPIAALNVGATIERLPERDMIERVLPVLRETAERLQPLLL
ncbi:MAG TPA: helix-turn-helix domain-containing protein, partial [Pseudonocardiaceae bacterium]